MIGIDISNYQASLDVKTITDSGFDFVIVKATEGRTISDRSFEKHYQAAKQARLPYGCYCYSHATTVEAAQAEAAFLLHVIQGKDMPLGVYMDVETDAQMALSNAQLQTVIESFCRVIRNAGYVPGLYGSEYRTWAKVTDLPADIIRWVAHYGKSPAINCDLWQSSDTGTISGYSGAIDTDVVMSTRMSDMVTGKGKAKDPIKATFPPDPTVLAFQLWMNYNGYAIDANGYKSEAFFKTLDQFVADMKSC